MADLPDFSDVPHARHASAAGVAGYHCGSLQVSLNVERLGTGHLAAGVGSDFVDPRFGLPQQFLAPPFQGLAALVNGDGFLQRHLAVLKPLDDRFEFLDRALKAQLLDVHLGVFGHLVFLNALFRRRRLEWSYAGVLWREITPPSMW